MLPKALRMLAKVRHCPRELFRSKCCVKICKVTYFYVINQFWELFEASSNTDSCCSDLAMKLNFGSN
jgi:hypothetical protein